LAEDAELIVSELSANAILHTASGQQSGSFHLALAVSSQVVALSVTDDGGTGTAPKAEHADQDATHGRGLGMVSAIAHRVVIHDSQAGHTVTAELWRTGASGGALRLWNGRGAVRGCRPVRGERCGLPRPRPLHDVWAEGGRDGSWGQRRVEGWPMR
jgi:hypothetical protein